jgi:hypothetical protein
MKMEDEGNLSGLEYMVKHRPMLAGKKIVIYYPGRIDITLTKFIHILQFFTVCD